MDDILRAIILLIGLLLIGLLVSSSPSLHAISPLERSGATGKSLQTTTKAEQKKPGRTIPFVSLSREEGMAHHPPDLEEPSIFVVGSAPEAERFAGWFDNSNVSDVSERIRKVDLTTTLIVAVFSGHMGSNGHGVTIKEVSTSPGRVDLRVMLTRPAPGHAASDVETYPYHMIMIPRKDLDLDPQTDWIVFTSDGKILSQTRYP